MLTRRRLLSAAAAAAGSQAAVRQHPSGQFTFVPGIAPYSGGAVANAGYEVAHAQFARPLPLKAAFQAVDEHLTSLKLPKTALCGMELRIPGALSVDGFRAFNTGYIDVLKSWGIFVDGSVNPVARTNVSPVLFPPSEPSIHAFSYVMRSTGGRKTFVVAGAGELPEGTLEPQDIIRRGETTAAALAEKARFVMGLMSGRLRSLGVSWRLATAINVYTAHDIRGLIVNEVLKPAAHNAAVWQYARPPIVDIEFEMDLRGVARELVLS